MESHLSNTSAKFYGEITQQMLKNASFPGSNNGTGLFQTIVGLKVRARFHTATGLHAGTQHGACTTPGASTSCRDICRLARNSCQRPLGDLAKPLCPPLAHRQVREVYERITEKEVVPV